MPTWPGSLPWEQFVGLVRRRKPAIIETQMDVGPPKVRALYSGSLQEHDVPIILNGDQLQVFDTWFATDLGFGALSFTWEDPVTDATVTFAFRAEDISWRLDLGGEADGNRMWSAVLPLRILP